MKNVMMSLMFAVTLIMGGYSFAEEAKAPAAPASEAAAAQSVLPASQPAAAVSQSSEPKAAEALAMDEKVDAYTEPPQWMKTTIGVVLKVPYIGPIAVEVLKWMGVLSALLTALAGVLLSIGMLLEKLGKSIGWLVKVKNVLDKIYPYVAWLSMLNVQHQTKKEDKPEEKKSA